MEGEEAKAHADLLLARALEGALDAIVDLVRRKAKLASRGHIARGGGESKEGGGESELPRRPELNRTTQRRVLQGLPLRRPRWTWTGEERSSQHSSLSFSVKSSVMRGR